MVTSFAFCINESVSIKQIFGFFQSFYSNLNKTRHPNRFLWIFFFKLFFLTSHINFISVQNFDRKMILILRSFVLRLFCFCGIDALFLCVRKAGGDLQFSSGETHIQKK